MLAFAFSGFTQSEINAMPKGPSTLDGVLKEWDPAKVAWHALYASDPREYLLQSAYLSTLSLYAVGGSAELIVRHIDEILHEYQKLLQVGAIQGSA